jgi:hypothetical protein
VFLSYPIKFKMRLLSYEAVRRLGVDSGLRSRVRRLHRAEHEILQPCKLFARELVLYCSAPAIRSIGVNTSRASDPHLSAMSFHGTQSNLIRYRGCYELSSYYGVMILPYAFLFPSGEDHTDSTWKYQMAPLLFYKGRTRGHSVLNDRVHIC